MRKDEKFNCIQMCVGFKIQMISTSYVSISFLFCVHTQSLSCVRFFGTLLTEAHQTPLSMGFSRQEYWSGLPCPSSPGDIPWTQGSNPHLLHLLPWQRWILYHLGRILYHLGRPDVCVYARYMSFIAILTLYLSSFKFSAI